MDLKTVKDILNCPYLYTSEKKEIAKKKAIKIIDILSDIDKISNEKFQFSEWISVEDKLPMETVEEGICGDYLVVVETKDPDPNVEPEILILWFDTTIRDFVYGPGDIKPYSEVNESWEVTYWAEKPPLPVRNRE